MSRSGATVQKFTFNREFDAGKSKVANAQDGAVDGDAPGAPPAGKAAKGPAKDAPPPPPPEPEKLFTQADLDAAREEGVVEGHTTALEEAETSRAHYVADALNLLSKGLEDLQNKQDQANEELAKISMRLTYAVLRKILPRCADDFATEEIDGMIKSVLGRIMDKPQVVVRVHQMIVDNVREKITPVFENTALKDKFTVCADYELQPGDCRIEWTNGGIERNTGRIWREIDKAVALSIGLSHPDEMDRMAREEEAAERKKAEAEAAEKGAAEGKQPDAAADAETKEK